MQQQIISLSQLQRQNLFKLMEICNLDAPDALKILKRTNFNLEQATQSFFTYGKNGPPVLSNQNNSLFPLQNQYPAINLPIVPPQYMQNFYPVDQQQQEQDPGYANYRKYRQIGKSFSQKFPVKTYQTAVANMFGWLIPSLKGELQGGEDFIRKIEQRFKKNSPINFRKGSLSENLHVVKKQHIPLILFLYSFEQYNLDSLKKIIYDEKLAKYVNSGFVNLGLDVRTYQWEKQLSHLYNKNDGSCILMIRIDEVDQIVVLERYLIDIEVDMSALIKKISQCKSYTIRGQMRESEYYKRYQKQIQGIYVAPDITFQRRLQINQERRLKKQQQKQLIEANRLYEEQLKAKNQKKKNQQKSYQQYKKQPQEEKIPQKKPSKLPPIEQNKPKVQNKKVEQMKLKREKLRKEIPQFTQGITFKIRLPSGQSIIKIIPKNKKVSFLFDIIQSIEDCGFSQNIQRKYQILRPYDRLMLRQKMNLTLEEVFQDSNSQALIVSQS